MNIEKMMPMIARDFDVEPVYISAESALYVAKREKVWHFVRHSEQSGRLIIDQFHFPRYEVAKEIQGLGAALKGNCSEAIDALSRKRCGDGILHGDELPDEVHKQIRRDLELLVAAQSRVRVENGEFTVPDVVTHAGHAVKHECREFMEAVQFELEVNGELDPRNFGVYSEVAPEKWSS